MRTLELPWRALPAPARSYVDAVRANILAGGDNASRAVLIGAVLAADNGLAAIPDEWKKKTNNYAELEALADKIIARRG